MKKVFDRTEMMGIALAFFMVGALIGAFITRVNLEPQAKVDPALFLERIDADQEVIAKRLTKACDDTRVDTYLSVRAIEFDYYDSNVGMVLRNRLEDPGLTEEWVCSPGILQGQSDRFEDAMMLAPRSNIKERSPYDDGHN